jgi:hypothetical protein
MNKKITQRASVSEKGLQKLTKKVPILRKKTHLRKSSETAQSPILATNRSNSRLPLKNPLVLSNSKDLTEILPKWLTQREDFHLKSTQILENENKDIPEIIKIPLNQRSDKEKKFCMNE